jgi:hypothetical protein
VPVEGVRREPLGRREERRGLCVTGCKRCMVFSAILLYLLLPQLPMPSLVEFLRDLVDPEDLVADRVIAALEVHGPRQPGEGPEAPALQRLESDPVAPMSSHELLLGERLARSGARRRHPVVFIPGIISTGLELWEGKKCAQRQFRRRWWGDTVQATKILTDVECWLAHMRLADNGSDPEGIRLRPATGLEAADVVMGAYSLWGPLVQQLAAIGYDPSQLHLASYDWRLRFDLLEERDGYFSQLKAQVEQMARMAGGEPAVFVTHSMGYNVFVYFLNWVHSRAATGTQCPQLPDRERQEREARYPQLEKDGALPPACDGWWARRYIKAWYNLAGPGAGTAKGLPAYFSGQMSSNADLGPIMGTIIEHTLPKRELRSLWRTFQSMVSLLPLGGSRIWGGMAGTGGSRAPFSGWDPSQEELAPSDGSRRWFIAPDEESSTGPATQGIFALRRYVAWERHDPAALTGKLLESLGRYLPAVWVPGKDDTLIKGLEPVPTVGPASEVEKEGSIHSPDPFSSTPTADSILQSVIGTFSSLLSHPGGTESVDSAKSFSPLERALRLVGVPDADADGTVTAQEGVSEALRRAGFQDRDGDGVVSVDELFFQTIDRVSPETEPDPVSNLFMSVEEVQDLIRSQSPSFGEAIDAFVDVNAWRPPTDSELRAWFPDDRYRTATGALPRRLWTNPLAVPLPDAPNMTVVCLYGTGRATERAFNYLAVRATPETPWTELEALSLAGNDTIDQPRAAGEEEEAEDTPSLVPIPVEIAAEYHLNSDPSPPPDSDSVEQPSGVGRLPPPERASHVRSGLIFSDGDGTVSTLSLGIVCEQHYQSVQGNPSRMPVITRELPFKGSTTIDSLLQTEAEVEQIDEAVLEEQVDEGGGTTTIASRWLHYVTRAGLVRGTVDFLRASDGQTSEHVDILLNSEVMQAILRSAAGEEDQRVVSRMVSNRTRSMLRTIRPNLPGLDLWGA